MANLFSSPNSKPNGARVTGLLLFCFVLFLLNFYLNYHFGLAQRDFLRSFIFAIPVPCFLAVGLLQFTLPNKTRQTSLPWYKDHFFLQKLWIWPTFLIYIPLLINGLMNNGLPDAVALPFEIGGILLMVYLVVQTIIARRSNGRTK